MAPRAQRHSRDERSNKLGLIRQITLHYRSRTNLIVRTPKNRPSVYMRMTAKTKIEVAETNMTHAPGPNLV
jgi:hypothetical protein